MTCSYDLSFTSIEWLYNGMTVISTTDSQLNLAFNPVNDTVNNRQYTCRVYSRSGFQEESVVVDVHGKFLSMSYIYIYWLLDMQKNLHYSVCFLILIFSAPGSSVNTSISAIGLAVPAQQH